MTENRGAEGVLPSVAAQHSSLASIAQDWIATQIIEGRIKPGEKLAEGALAEQMGISRSPVREALRSLSAQGLIVVEPRRGAFVAELDAEHAADLYVCRLLIEPACIQEVARSIDDGTLARLEESFGDMTAAAEGADSEAYVAALTNYNRQLFDACPNRLLFGYAESTWRSSLRYWALLVRHSGQYSQQSLRRNGKIQAALRKRDPEKAFQATTELLQWSREELLSVLTKLPTGK
ncbi:GntR family transcriptional regulator [Nocardioides sp. LHG3406-4]|uniref:GntR family transcriptional regulator n=1 Tax=Nocardioides sp. LHG3406-4 TaxID=2804575 RepID=UPI003CE9443E